jgi:methylated-DNA-protein-cysteine methyltransferase-like protein
MTESAEHVRLRIWSVIRKIPRGRVATYGQIAALAGIPGQPRRVSQALHAAPPASSIPWQRVVSAGGVLGLARYDAMAGWGQRVLLEQEGVRFGRRGRISLSEFGWNGRPSSASKKQAPKAPRPRKR